jgi:hypothetical protein
MRISTNSYKIRYIIGFGGRVKEGNPVAHKSLKLRIPLSNIVIILNWTWKEPFILSKNIYINMLTVKDIRRLRK